MRDKVLECVVQNLSAMGAGITLPGTLPSHYIKGSRVQLAIENTVLQRATKLNAKIMRLIPDKSGVKESHYVGLKFEPENLEEQRDIVALAFGNSAMLIKNLRNRQRSIGIASGVGFLLKTGVMHGYDHLAFRFHQFIRIIYEYLKQLASSPLSQKTAWETSVEVDNADLIDLSEYKQSRKHEPDTAEETLMLANEPPVVNDSAPQETFKE